jgi:hypothetical protein
MSALQCRPTSTFLVYCIGPLCLSEEPPLSQGLVYDVPLILTGEKPSLANLCTFVALLTTRNRVRDLPRLTVIPLTVFSYDMDPHPSMLGTFIR